ncbi:MAG TPA: RNA methyltransferase, partial [Candidatus Acidoferrales bacterium]|nr:RNA methyltransferase [Candidatus Acidoferrales bacterium]
MSLRNVRIVLVRPKGAANVGAVARAMKNMGLDDLVVVRPRLASSALAKVMAVHAGDVLQRMRRCDSLLEAVADCALVVGTTCREGPYRAAAEAPRTVAPRIVDAAARQPVALVFGPEDHGLSNDDLKGCHQLIQIPTADAYPSLNLAQAVMVCCYELCQAQHAADGVERSSAK